MARSREVNIFSTSFLDLLSCGMGAVIILLFIFMGRLSVSPRDATPFATVLFRVDYGDTKLLPFRERWELGDGKPLLSIRPISSAGTPFEYCVRESPPSQGRGDENLASALAGEPNAQESVSSSFQADTAALEAIRITYRTSGRCSGERPRPPTRRRETSVFLANWEQAQRIVYRVERNALSTTAIHHFDQNLIFTTGAPAPGRGWMSHDYSPGVNDFRYAYPLRVEVVVYTTQSPRASSRTFLVHQYLATSPAEFRIVVALDPDADPGADPIKEPLAP